MSHTDFSRRMAVWGQKWYIVAPLVLISLGHWSLLLHGILLTAAWIPGQGCIITSTDSKLLSITFIYSMIFDFTVLILTASKLVRPSGTKSQLVNMMFADGLYYFIIAYVCETSRRSQRRRSLISMFSTVFLRTWLLLCVNPLFLCAELTRVP
jgi:hypothetical protein